MSDTDVAIIGAGPYGLSLAAHLAHRDVPHRIFGEPMQFWSQLAQAGGQRYLKSFCFGTSLSTPDNGFSFGDFNAPLGLETFEPCTMANFVNYGLWFKERAVRWTEDVDVIAVARRGNRFALQLATGAIALVRHVVIATGLTGYARLPSVLSAAPPSLVTHTSAITRFGDFEGRRVAVIGAGQSALEAAALLREAGARPELIVRTRSIRWMTRTARDRTLWQRLRSPISALGTGPKAMALTRFPGAMHHLAPACLRARVVRTHLPPEGAWWLRPRVEHKIPVHYSASVVKVRETADGIALTLATPDCASACEIVVDRIVAGTGFAVDIDRLDFLDAELRRQIERIEEGPRLTEAFESTVPGLYFVGPASAMSFGPLFRFVAGVPYTSTVLSQRLKSVCATR